MSNSKLNYHKVLFTLQTLNTPEQKIAYLYNVKLDINRIIKCFTSPKFQNLKKYAKKNIFAEDGCDELSEFLKEVIGYYNSPNYGDQYISDEILKRHVKEEVIKYKNFLKIVDSELEFWINKRENINIKNKIEDDEMKELNNTEAQELKEHLKNVDSSTSMRELKEKQAKKITWHGSKEDLIKFFDELFSQQLLRIKSYDEIFSIVSHYFVDKEGNQIFVEKSASAKMNLHGPKIPDGYQRYMKSIEKLKKGLK